VGAASSRRKVTAAADQWQLRRNCGILRHSCSCYHSRRLWSYSGSWVHWTTRSFSSASGFQTDRNSPRPASTLPIIRSLNSHLSDSHVFGVGLSVRMIQKDQLTRTLSWASLFVALFFNFALFVLFIRSLNNDLCGSHVFGVRLSVRGSRRTSWREHFPGVLCSLQFSLTLPYSSCSCDPWTATLLRPLWQSCFWTLGDMVRRSWMTRWLQHFPVLYSVIAVFFNFALFVLLIRSLS